jgi:hypothetical protein
VKLGLLCEHRAGTPLNRAPLGAYEMKLNLRRRTYIVLCVLACVTPVALVFVQFASDVSPSAASGDDILFAALGNFAASVLTYPAGVVGTIAFCVLIYVGLLTPTEAVLFAAPLYIGAGYFQWYVLIPKHFRVSPNSALNPGAPPSQGDPQAKF